MDHSQTDTPDIAQSPTTIRVHNHHGIISLPSFLPARGWTIQPRIKSYVTYTSRAVKTSTTKGMRRGARLHIAVIEHLLGHKVALGKVVHHMDFNKANCCPCNLIYMDAEFNVSPSRRCPLTGQFLSPAEHERRYGERGFGEREEIPEWVTEMSYEIGAEYGQAE